jgi:hypothetical protein
MFFFNGIISLFHFLVKLFIIDLFGGLVNIFKSIISLIIKGFVFAYESFISFILNPVGGILRFIYEIFKLITMTIENIVRYAYIFFINLIFNPISSMGVIFTTLWNMVKGIFTYIALIFLSFSDALAGVGSDISHFFRIIYKFFMDLMNFNVAVGQSSASVAASATATSSATNTTNTANTPNTSNTRS